MADDDKTVDELLAGSTPISQEAPAAPPASDRVLFDDVVARAEAREAAATAAAAPPPLPPQRVAPPPTLDPSKVAFAPPERDYQDVATPFSAWNPNSVFDPAAYIPSGRLLPGPDPAAQELTWEDTVPEPMDDRFVVLKQDVWEEVASPNSDRPTHVLRFSKGQRVPKAVLAGLKVKAVEESPVRNVETKGRQRRGS